MVNLKWTKITVLLEAKKYNTKTEFKNTNSSAYQAALKYGIDKFCGHMIILNLKV